MRQTIFLCLAIFVAYCNAQTATVVVGGLTVVEVVTTGANGRPSTQVLQTLTATSVATTKTATTPQQGPVGQPAPTTTLPNGVTPYTYTTVDVNGITTTVVDNFTPTVPATVAPTVGASGTILDYSSWLSIYGHTSTTRTNTTVKIIAPGWVGLLIGVVTAVVSGFRLVLM